MDLAAGQLGEKKETLLLQHVLKTAEKDNAESVIKAIDEYCENVSWMMNVGPIKGALVDTYVRSCNPHTALELGTYCGYSAVRIASGMQQPSSKLISLEISAANVEIATQVIHHAGNS
jgi:catechol O-methyltransferase